MKAVILLLLTLSSAWAKPIVMISYYDAFNRAPFNSSEKVAKALALRLNTSETSFEIRLCALNTIFDRAYAQSEDCLKNLPESPLLFLGLGESTCDLKIETMMRNNDRTFGPDNAGNNRRNTPVVAGAPGLLGLRYPLPQMFCALNSAEKNSLVLSNNAGSFVCNNTAYQMTNFHPEIQYGFIHVPANNCANLAAKMESSIEILSKMIKQAVIYLEGDEVIEGLPHQSNDIRLSTKKDDLRKLKRFYDKKNECLSDYLNRIKI
jgi:pyrrolidone-carboxylate peptidase